MTYGEKKYAEAKAGLYPLVRLAAFLTLAYSIVFTFDLLLPFSKSSETLLRREKIAHRSLRSSGPGYYYWVTNDFKIQVSKSFYYAFREGASVELEYTPLMQKVFRVAYNLNGEELIQVKSRLYYLYLLVSIFVAYSSILTVRSKNYTDMAYHAGLSAILFALVLVFWS